MIRAFCLGCRLALLKSEGLNYLLRIARHVFLFSATPLVSQGTHLSWENWSLLSLSPTTLSHVDSSGAVSHMDSTFVRSVFVGNGHIVARNGQLGIFNFASITRSFEAEANS